MKKNQKDKISNFFKWLKNECKDSKTFIVLICVIAVVYSPVWIGGLLYAILGWEWCGVMASITAAIWIGPVPFFPICIAIALSIKKIMQVKKNRKKEKNKKQQRKVLNWSV